jgi:hypothetical protein
VASGNLARSERIKQELVARKKSRAEIARDILAFVRALGGQITSRLPPLAGEEMTVEFPVGSEAAATFVQVCKFHPRMVAHGIATRWAGTTNRLLPGSTK